jgi:exodeoxyribonuclease-3
LVLSLNDSGCIYNILALYRFGLFKTYKDFLAHINNYKFALSYYVELGRNLNMILISYNVNGLRAAIGKGLVDFIAASRTDFVLLQETKGDAQVDFSAMGYAVEHNISKRRGYEGVALLFKKKPINVMRGFENAELDAEGRLIVLEYPSYYIANVYVPNSQGGLERWYYRLAWDEALVECVARLRCQKPVVIGGDFNVAHEYIDVYPENTKNLEKQAGFRNEERGGFDKLLEAGFVDSFRYMRPEERGAYTWRSAKCENRQNNRGRRLDYFLVSEGLEQKIRESSILSEVLISDHSPIKLVLDL